MKRRTGGPESPEAFLDIRGVRKAFDGVEVLEGIDLSVAQGERLVLLGPSGCGKSTLLNLVAGMFAADGGEIVCEGEVLDRAESGIHQPMRRRGFAMVFQDFALWPHMTVFENVAFGLRVQGVAGAARRARVLEVLEMVRMEAFADRRPNRLSGGQKQRVAIARALAVRPRLLLLDEPLSALDARLREELKAELGRLLKDTGITSIYVTHDQSEAFALASRIALMNEGRIEQVGTPEAVYAEPSGTFPATFLGVSNIFEWSAADGAIRIGEGTPVPIRPPGNRTAPRAGRLLVRRESVIVDSEPSSPNGMIALTGICRRKDFLGDRHEAFVEVEGGMVVRGFAPPSVEPGRSVEVRFSPEAVRFLER